MLCHFEKDGMLRRRFDAIVVSPFIVKKLACRAALGLRRLQSSVQAQYGLEEPQIAGERNNRLPIKLLHAVIGQSRRTQNLLFKRPSAAA